MKKLSEYTCLYSPLDIEYSQVMSGRYEDISYHGEDCTVIAGLKDGWIDGFWRPCVAVGEPKSLKLHIERLWDISRQIGYMDFLEGGQLSAVSRFLLKRGYKATPHFTQIIDLTDDEETLRRKLRKSYKSLVNKDDDVRSCVFGVYKDFHQQVREEIRRTPESFDVQEQMVRTGNAFCLRNTDGCVLIYHNHQCAYYAGSKSFGDTHALVWRAILMAKSLGCKMFEMGEQVFSGDKKLVDISKFKKGFAGQTVTRLILEPRQCL